MYHIYTSCHYHHSPHAMSGPSSVHESLRQIPTADAIRSEHQISLIDTERRASLQDGAGDAERGSSEIPAAPGTPGPSPLTKRLTNASQLQQSVKREWTKRKYARYDRNRYDLGTETPPPEEAPESQPQPGEAATAQQASFLERSRAHARSVLKRKRAIGTAKHHEDTYLEILYENQRGLFLFGVPKYSSSSLLPSDPKPWLNAQFRTSPVDIRNAQVPDPSWEWSWKSWYVDMSRDVDEEGWEYSFNFFGKWSWHGNHPWFHSFVRRRRWLRMRKRKDTSHQTREKAHELTAEYFTIHPSTIRPLSEIGSNAMAKEREKAEGVNEPLEKLEILDIGSLMLVLKRVTVDREKLLAVRKFVNTAKDELYYLADRMPEIMSLFIYQSSRRQLLADLLHRFDEAHKMQQDLTAHEHEEDGNAQQEHDAAAKHADNLINAVHAADEQVKRLEFWSDIKTMAQHGDLLTAESGGDWDRSKWQGLVSPTSAEHDHPEQVFKNKQKASEGTQQLHPQPEHSTVEEEEKEQIPGERRRTMPYWDAKEHSDSSTGAYSTAAESASQISGKGKGKKGGIRVSGLVLDGVDESEETDPPESALPEDAIEDAPEPVPEEDDDPQPSLYTPMSPRKKSSVVEFVEPVPEPTPSSSRAGEGS